eukprot:jgi/Orpsp1_1/1181604/evm.model.c7180000077887.1
MNSRQPIQHKVPALKYLFPTPDVLKITWANDETGLVYQLTKYVIANTSLKVENDDDYTLIYEGDKQFVLINNIFPGTYCFRLRVKKPKDRHWSMDYKEMFVQI